jgi:MFS family permease
MTTSSAEQVKSPKLARGVRIALLLLALAGQLAWGVENQYFNTFLYDRITPNPQAVSLMVAVTAVVSTVTAITMGTMSDRTRSKWGKRKPYIFLGYILWGIFTALFPFAALFQPVALGVFIAILFDSLMSYAGATASDAALNAYVADVTTKENRGKVVGSMQIMTWVAYLIVYGGAGFIIKAFDYPAFFYGVGGLVLLIGVLATPHLKEEPTGEKPHGSYWAMIAETFNIKFLKSHRDLFLLLICLSLFMVAFNVFFPFIIIYLQHFLNLDILQSSIVLAVTILIGGIALAYPIGIIVDKWGRKPVAIAAVICECVGLTLFSFARTLPFLIITCILWLAPYTAWVVAMQTWTKDMFPEDKRGQFAGWYIFFNIALSMIPGPLLGGWIANTYGLPTIIDGKAGMVPTPLVFQVAAGMVLFTLIPLLLIKKGQKKEITAEEIIIE